MIQLLSLDNLFIRNVVGFVVCFASYLLKFYYDFVLFFTHLMILMNIPHQIFSGPTKISCKSLFYPDPAFDKPIVISLLTKNNLDIIISSINLAALECRLFFCLGKGGVVVAMALCMTIPTSVRCFVLCGARLWW